MSLLIDAVVRSSLVLVVGLAAVWLLRKAAGRASPLGPCGCTRLLRQRSR